MPDSVKAADDARKRLEEDRKNARRTAAGKGKGKATGDNEEGQSTKKKRKGVKADPALVGLAGLSSDAALEAFASANPFFIRQVHIAKLPRAACVPATFWKFEQSLRRVNEHLHVLQQVKGYIGSYLPPPSLFYTVRDNERLYRYVRSSILLMPALALRVPRKLPRLPTSKWKEVLNGEYWRPRWPVGQRQAFSMDGDFWRYGRAEIFGEDAAERIAKGEVPSLGRLRCGCEASRDTICQDGVVSTLLAQDVVFGLNQWALLHQLPALVMEALERAGFTAVQDGPARHITPDFMSGEDAPLVIKNILNIVTKGEPVPADGWPKIWCGFDELELEDRRKHLNALRRFLLFYNDQKDYFEHKEGWAAASVLRDQDLLSYDDTQLSRVTQEYLDRLAISCLKAQQWPTEFFFDIEDPHRALHCWRCRAPAGLAQAEPGATWEDEGN